MATAVSIFSSSTPNPSSYQELFELNPISNLKGINHAFRHYRSRLSPILNQKPDIAEFIIKEANAMESLYRGLCQTKNELTFCQLTKTPDPKMIALHFQKLQIFAELINNSTIVFMQRFGSNTGRALEMGNMKIMTKQLLQKKLDHLSPQFRKAAIHLIGRLNAIEWISIQDQQLASNYNVSIPLLLVNMYRG